MRIFNKLAINFVVAFSCVTMLSGCSSEKTAETPTLKLANSRIYSADIIGTPWKNQILATSLMYRSLFITDIDTMTETNDLVDYFEISDDLLEYKFKIKDNILWSDGEVLDRDDIIFSIKAVLLANNVNNVYKTAFGSILGVDEFLNSDNINSDLDGIYKDGEFLNIKLKNPVSNIIQVLAQFAILPEHCFTNANVSKIDEDDYWKNPVVSGMFKVEEMVANDHIKLVFNDKYIGDTPKIKEIILYENYAEEELDLYSTTNISEVLSYRSLPNMKEYSIDSLFYRYLVFNINKDDGIDEVLNDIRFREAIKYAIDRKNIINDVYYGTGTIINSGIFSDDYSLFPNEEIYYNKDTAKELLSSMNFDFEREIRIFSYYEDAVSKLFIEALKSQLEEIGLKIQLIEYDNQNLYSFNDYDICLKGLSAFDYMDWYTEYLSTNSLHVNLIGAEPLFDDLVGDLEATISTEEKAQIFEQLQLLESEMLYKLPLFTLAHMVYINTDRLIVPNEIKFGNTWYKYDMNFEKWYIQQN